MSCAEHMEKYQHVQNFRDGAKERERAREGGSGGEEVSKSTPDLINRVTHHINFRQ